MFKIYYFRLGCKQALHCTSLGSNLFQSADSIVCVALLFVCARDHVYVCLNLFHV